MRLSRLLLEVLPQYRYHVAVEVYAQLRQRTLPGVKFTNKAPMDVPIQLGNGRPGRLTWPEAMFLNLPEVQQQVNDLAAQVVRSRLLRNGGRDLTQADLDHLTAEDLKVLMAQPNPREKKHRRCPDSSAAPTELSGGGTAVGQLCTVYGGSMTTSRPRPSRRT